MAKLIKSSKPGFVIKLSCETVQKLTEEEVQAKSQVPAPKLELRSSDSERHDNKPALGVRAVSTDDGEASVERVQPAKVEKKSGEVSDVSPDSWGPYAAHVTYEGAAAVYTDPATRQQYLWDAGAGAWGARDPPPERAYTYEHDTHIYTEPDGSKYFWDVDKKAWIPKVDDDFLALYQMSYGFVENAPQEKKKDEPIKKDIQNKSEQAGVKRKIEPQWFEPSEENNTKVYVSNLPLDLTEEEFVNLMQKCGLVERDPASQKMKIKLYMDKEQNCFKGDALCTYIKIESVELALKLLDGSDLRGNKIRVERAHFQLKGQYNPSLKPKKKKKKEIEKIKKMQQKLFDWRPEKFVGERSKHERVVIVKNLFHPTDFDNEVQLILDYQQDLREECSKCGEVRKVVIYDRHPEGVAQITMKEPEQADAVILLINGRWFGKRQITAEIWDGRTKYKIAETDADIGVRINKWDKYLAGDTSDSSKVDPSAGSGVEEASNSNKTDPSVSSSIEETANSSKTGSGAIRGVGETSDSSVTDPSLSSSTESEDSSKTRPSVSISIEDSEDSSKTGPRGVEETSDSCNTCPEETVANIL